MGSVSANIDEKGMALCSDENWKRHKETVASLWDSISNYLDALEVNGLKIYQDGLVADGELGMKIIQDGVSKGSKNYEIISRLIQRGARIIKTEDLSIIMKEYNHVIKMAQAKSFPERLIASLKYKFEKSTLLKERDEYIARQINETLGEGEIGIIFIGAQHDIIPRLSRDIEVLELKERKELQRYQRTLLYARRKKAQFEELAKYLSSSIT